MIHAIIQSGGKQYIVKQGDVVSVEKLDANDGQELELHEILALFDDTGENTIIGTPFVINGVVKTKVLGSGKGKKITVVKFKPKVRYKRKRGHRQRYTKIEITSLSSPSTPR